MTDQKYKLVPVEPTAAMLQVGKHSAPYRVIDVYRAMIKVAPEPVCKWTFVGIGFDSECGWHVEQNHGEYPHDSPYPFCPHCGKKVEVVEDE